MGELDVSSPGAWTEQGGNKGIFKKESAA